MTCGLTCSSSFGNVAALWNKRHILGALVLCDAVVIVGFRPHNEASNLISMHDPLKHSRHRSALSKCLEELTRIHGSIGHAMRDKQFIAKR
jgi:hypothetical protein